MLQTRLPPPVLAALLAVLLTLPSLGGGFVQDDLSLYTLATRWPGDPLGERAPWDLFRFWPGEEQLHRMREQGLAPWWTSDELRLAFFRPLSSLWHWLDFRLFGRAAWLHHLGSVLAYGASALAVGWTMRQIEPDGPHGQRVAGLACALWAVDDAHGMPVGWISNRNAVLAWGLGALALGVHHRWRQGWAPGALLGPLLFALALGAGETGLGALAYLLAHAIALERGSWALRARALLGYGLVFVAWRVVYALGGYGTAGSSFYVDPADDPAGFLAVLPERAIALLAGQFGPLPADLMLVLPPEGRPLFVALSLGVVLAAGALLWPVVRGDERARFWLLGLGLAAVPMAAAWPSQRLLGFVGLGAMALVARRLVAPGSPWVKGPLWLVHGALPLLLLPASSLLLVLPGAQQRAAGEAMTALGEALSGRELVVVAAPDWFVPAFGSLQHRVDGGAAPRALRLLVSAQHPLQAVRLDERTLRLSCAEGFLRDPLAQVVRDEPLRAGQRHEVGGWTIELLQTDARGRPTELSFRAPTPLDDPDRIWLTWDGQGLSAFTLP